MVSPAEMQIADKKNIGIEMENDLAKLKEYLEDKTFGQRIAQFALYCFSSTLFSVLTVITWLLVGTHFYLVLNDGMLWFDAFYFRQNNCCRHQRYAASHLPARCSSFAVPRPGSRLDSGPLRRLRTPLVGTRASMSSGEVTARDLLLSNHNPFFRRSPGGYDPRFVGYTA